MATPIRNSKTGFADSSSQTVSQQPNVLHSNDPNAPAPLVQQSARQNLALQQGVVTPMVSTNVAQQPIGSASNRIMGRFEQQAPMAGANGSPIPSIGNVGIQKQEGVGNPMFGTEDARITNHSDLSQNDMGALSSALARAGSSASPAFKQDASKRDGGFFGWLKGLLPKSRPGKRDGETDDEYDYRMTENKKRLTALADAMRHIGNIVNTNRYAPAQQFNSPVAALEQSYQQRKAQRIATDKANADAAYKAANLSLKEKAAKASDEYKKLQLLLNEDRNALSRDRFNYKQNKDYADFNYKIDKDKRDFDYKKEQDAKKNSLAAQRIAVSAAKGKGGGKSGSSGGKYHFVGKDGKMRYQQNKTMWMQDFYKEYGYLPEGANISTSVETIDKNGNKKVTTTRTKGEPIVSKAAKAQKASEAANRNKSKSGKYKNTARLGL